MRVKFISALVLINLLLACGSKKFGLNPVVNKTYHFSVVQKIVNHFGDIERSQALKAKFSLQSLQQGDSSSTFLFTITGLRLDPTPPYLLEVMNFDSLEKVLASSSYEVSIDNSGRVVNLKGEDKLRNNVLAVFSSRYIARSFTDDHFGANAVKDLLNRFFSMVPHKEMTENDNWVKDVTLITKAPVKLSNLFTYEGKNGDSVFIKIKSLISADQGDASTVYLKGDLDGEVVINAATGMPYRYHSEATMITTTVAGRQPTDEYVDIRQLN